MGEYRWATPHEWLQDKLQAETDPQKLREFAIVLMAPLDSDQLQDIFEHEMNQDGYFKHTKRRRR